MQNHSERVSETTCRKEGKPELRQLRCVLYRSSEGKGRLQSQGGFSFGHVIGDYYYKVGNTNFISFVEFSFGFSLDWGLWIYVSGLVSRQGLVETVCDCVSDNVTVVYRLGNLWDSFNLVNRFSGSNLPVLCEVIPYVPNRCVTDNFGFFGYCS